VGPLGRVLVTGAAGFAGSHALDLLAAEQATIIGWGRPGSAVPQSPPGVTWRLVDVTSGADVDRAIAQDRPDVVLHLAGDAHSNRSAAHVGTTLLVNVCGTSNVLNAIGRHARHARVIVAGSALIYSAANEPLTESSPVRPSGAYAVSKLAQEMVALRAAEHDGLHVIVARAFNHIGPRQSPEFIASSLAKQIALIETGRLEPTLFVGNLDPRRDLTDVRDMVRAYRALVDRGTRGLAYNVCRGEALSVRELIDALVARASVPVNVVVDPQRVRKVDIPLVLGSHARLTSDTGWQPEVPFDRTLDDLLAYWREQTSAGTVPRAT
jgi:GDP-4-dehydro-6-deoxy-D-mannose reductase